MRLPNALRFVRAPLLFIRAAWRAWNAATTVQQAISVATAFGVAGALFAIFTGLPPGWRFLVAVLLLLFAALAISLGLEEARAWWFRYRNRELGGRCIRLADDMNAYLADRQRMEPDTAPTRLPHSASEEEHERDWVRGAELRRRHDTGMTTGFNERYRTRTVGLLAELVRKDHLTEDEMHSVMWSMNGAFIERVADTLAAKGYELTGGQDPP
jgi:hypothetical protein